MKNLMIAIAFAGTLSTTSAFAQSTPSANSHATDQPTQLASNITGAASADGRWAGADSQPVAGKTRAEVYRELVHAEQDGQLAYLNSTLYAHP